MSAHTYSVETFIIELIPNCEGLDDFFFIVIQVVSVYYSRKNFLRPELQPEEHRSFDVEVDYLDGFFHEGHAYCMGSLKQDRWYLYTYHIPQPDHTLEILMTDLDENVLHLFTKDACLNGKDCTERAGIDHIVPNGTLIHEELFDPCGYSMNAFMPYSDHYATIHVTPEKEFSFASFETNQDHVCLYKQTKKVLKCFRPGKIMMTVFANDGSTKGREAQQQLWDRELSGYKRTNVQFVRLEVCTLQTVAENVYERS
ncbi:unnamed protein product [Heligmosomoides polygyrus]|uniref:Adenosylmethionine decarboxylase n=1 Tax=Heligmosomoides polygyrus TaxID=6339 RepID=A0A183GLL0_HELPZ|nr:unnamed protein product [Heligmosomoides polygyrus]